MVIMCCGYEAYLHGQWRAVHQSCGTQRPQAEVGSLWKRSGAYRSKVGGRAPLEDELPTSAPEHIYGTTLLTTIYFIHYDGMADN